MLTDYEKLPAFVPNLMLCERLPVPPEYAGRVVRLRQVRLTSPTLPLLIVC